ncbi:LuxR C-terminal-related transcriptional regulator [Actinomadura opuntiae]|uniref:LuxR C-terminal-related transcriptional regulator n=1 Tax=Actinomadura sp. OS1-43 TaxID=604315 RepID=UPI00255AE9AE|nr:LuxR C-terminal-related transcriptional regulator [Actinomadura sp. OS1-43]MDL4819558.1 LuxR C-terminal-related transcriptional regulator [Actinomadura sp. OS1-43]
MTEPNSPTGPNPLQRTNLPAEPNAFVGRERDAADLRRLLEAMRAVTLCGAGGIGKTRLALHVARTMLDAHPDGVWFVDLAGVRPGGTPEAVARRVAAVLDVADEDGRRTAETLADALRGPSVLIVLDNCEHVIEECAELTGLLLARCPRLRVLATSREPLRMAGENVWRVPPLEPHEAVRLFTDRARAARPGFDVTSGVEDVTRALDGMPLALELAAARVRVLSVEQIAGRLADRFRLLSAGDRTAPPRQRTLRAAIDWSHDLLGEPERILLRRLSVFAGWTLEGAEHVCADEALPAEDVLDLLTALVDKSLVAVVGETAGQVRFRQLDSIREYAAERLAEAGEDETFRLRHRDTVLEAAEDDGRLAVAEVPGAWADRVALFRRYDAELGNVQAALTFSLDRGDIEKGLRLCTALRTFWIVRGRVAEWAEWTDRFLARSHGTGARTLGAALAGRAQLAAGGRDAAQAARYAEEALGPCRAAGDAIVTASALVTLAESLARAGRFEDAAQRLDEADAIAAGPGHEWVRAYARITRGYLLIRRGRLREARGHLDEGATLMRQIGQLWGAAHAIIGLGRLAELRGDPAAARVHYAEVLPILAEIGARPEMARALAGIGRVALEQQDPESAREALSRSLSLSRSSGIRLDVARALEAFAELAAFEGDARGAVTLAGAASALREATGRHPGAGARRERMLEPIRRRLGDPLVAQFWGEGRAMPPDDAIDYALHTPPAPTPTAEKRATPTSPTTNRPHPEQAPSPERDPNTAPASAKPATPTLASHAGHSRADGPSARPENLGAASTADEPATSPIAEPTPTSATGNSHVRGAPTEPAQGLDTAPDCEKLTTTTPEESGPTPAAGRPDVEGAPTGSMRSIDTAFGREELAVATPAEASPVSAAGHPCIEGVPAQPGRGLGASSGEEAAAVTSGTPGPAPGVGHSALEDGSSCPERDARVSSSGEEAAVAASGTSGSASGGGWPEMGESAWGEVEGNMPVTGEKSAAGAVGPGEPEPVQYRHEGTAAWSEWEGGRAASGGRAAAGGSGAGESRFEGGSAEEGVAGAGESGVEAGWPWGEGSAWPERYVGMSDDEEGDAKGASGVAGRRSRTGYGASPAGGQVEYRPDGGAGEVGEGDPWPRAFRAGEAASSAGALTESERNARARAAEGGGARYVSGSGARGGGRGVRGYAGETMEPARPATSGVARPVTPPSTLTAREREIARLVARGLTNRGIADELVISPATVARHVTNILTKLGFSSRAQIAAWVVDSLPAED